MAKKIHMVLQGKGGVGKSFIAATLAQYKDDNGNTPTCIDTDPVNATFFGYKALDPKKIEIMEDDDINPRRFDDMVEEIVNAPGDVIIDNGASTFVPMSKYLITNAVPSLFASMGFELIIHTVVTGGQALEDTLVGFASIASQFSSEDTQIIVWLNPYWGPIVADGKGFEKMKAYGNFKDRVTAIIKIPDWKKETFSADLSDMLKSKMTFKEAIDRSDINIMHRQRLTMIRKEIYAQLEGAVVL